VEQLETAGLEGTMLNSRKRVGGCAYWITLGDFPPATVKDFWPKTAETARLQETLVPPARADFARTMMDGDRPDYRVIVRGTMDC
jgi:hypothetical protein